MTTGSLSAILGGAFRIYSPTSASETFTPHAQSAAANAVGINQNPLVHGNSGPVNVSFSSYVYNETVNFFAALQELQMPISYDPNDGTTAGASFLPLSLNPATQTRCDARSAYFEPYAARPNLWIETNQYVTRVLFEGGSGNPNTTIPTPGDASTGQGSSFSRPDGLFSNITQNAVAHKREPTNTPVTSVGGLMRATGVEFASAASVPRKNITAIREVIVAAGAIHTPQLLKLSGLGPSSELQPLHIPVLVDLPGVGMNLQDHALVGVFYPYQKPTSLTSVQIASNYTLMSQFSSVYQANRTGPWTAGPPDGNAFPALSVVTNRSFSIVTRAQTQKAKDYLPGDVHPNVLAGFEAQRQLLIKALQDPRRAAYELLNFNYGAFSNVNMRPFSRGSVKLNSSHPFDPPLIDPRYGSNPVDLDVLLASIVYNRQVLATTSMKALQPLQLNPSQNATDQQILDFIKANVQTEFHPSGTCAMLPLDLGGVVDPNLLVYGTQNLRLVDASIMPVIPASHLQAVVYGIAEKVGIEQVALTTHSDVTIGRRHYQERKFGRVVWTTAACIIHYTEHNASYYIDGSIDSRLFDVNLSFVFDIIASIESVVAVNILLLSVQFVAFNTIVDFDTDIKFVFIAATDIVFVATVDFVIAPVVDFPSDQFITSWCHSITFARDNSILYTCIGILVHMFVCLHVNNFFDLIVYLLIDLVCSAKLKLRGVCLPTSIDLFLPSCAYLGVASFIDTSIHICADIVFNVKHELRVVTRLVDHDSLADVILIVIIISTLVAPEFCTISKLFLEALLLERFHLEKLVKDVFESVKNLILPFIIFIWQ
ncbi:hypothetical protein QM012_006676 [Aureobasidium pullulans]|uniref:Glucose-methanol-choline oxidoreductase N-terminal domain-containing protein n=1 Tax=Aureobasidium pullulans TaxID=5580 RepID=A0ABR0TQ79_AURPU